MYHTYFVTLPYPGYTSTSLSTKGLRLVWKIGLLFCFCSIPIQLVGTMYFFSDAFTKINSLDMLKFIMIIQNWFLKSRLGSLPIYWFKPVTLYLYCDQSCKHICAVCISSQCYFWWLWTENVSSGLEKLLASVSWRVTVFPGERIQEHVLWWLSIADQMEFMELDKVWAEH